VIPTLDPGSFKDRDPAVKIRSSRRRDCLAAKVVVALAVALFPEALFCQTSRPIPPQDFQGWADIEASHPLGERTAFVLSSGLRYGNDQGHLIYRRIATAFAFRWHRFFTFEPYYQYSVSDPISGSISHENRLAFATTVGTPWKRWQISDRNLGERRFVENRRLWRYRNRVEIQRPIVVAKKQLGVFVWDEVFYGSDAGRWYRNRFALGAGQKISKRIAIDVYYLRQDDGYSLPGNLNVLGMTIKTHF
jgi:Protein of unknown function (DUF2490)